MKKKITEEQKKQAELDKAEERRAASIVSAMVRKAKKLGAYIEPTPEERKNGYL